MPMMYYGGWNWGGVLFMMLTALFWVILLGVLTWVAIRWAASGGVFGPRTSSTTGTDTRGAPTAQEPSAHEIVARRYARGEIDAATYEEMLAHLERQAAPAPQPLSETAPDRALSHR